MAYLARIQDFATNCLSGSRRTEECYYDRSWQKLPASRHPAKMSISEATGAHHYAADNSLGSMVAFGYPRGSMDTQDGLTLDRHARVYVAGHCGLAGSSIWRELKRQGFVHLIGKTRAELDLMDTNAVRQFYTLERPDYVFVAAAKVGGIHANDTQPAEFLFENLQIQNNVIHEAWRAGVKKLLFLGSSCIYPKLAPQPLREAYLLTGPLEPTNEWYAVAKIAGLKLCQAYRRQHRADFITAIPAGLYGPNDSYDPANSHVLPALIRRCHEAKTAGSQTLTCWGSGTPLRELLHADDFARACILLMEHYSDEPPINLGSGAEVTIGELTELVRKIVGCQSKIFWDRSKPDGTPRKLLDSSRLFALGWRPQIELGDGIARAYEDFLNGNGNKPR